MTRKELKDLGFTEEFVTKQESGSETDFWYYTYDAYGICLISDAFDRGDVEDKQLKIEFFNCDDCGNNPLPDKLVKTIIESFEDER